MRKYAPKLKTSILFLLVFWATLLNAQQYPVVATPVLLPPYSLKLGDYATTTENKLQLQLLMKDLMEPLHRIRISFSLESGVNATPIATSNPFVTGFQEITLFPGELLTLTNIDLRPLFRLENLSGISAVDYARPLPQGMYRFCFQVFDAVTGRTLSAKSYATVYLVQYEPPVLNLPQQGEKVLKQNEFQHIIFQWMPRQMAPNTRYVFTLKELWDYERDPVSGFYTSRPLWQEETYAPTLYYGIDKTALIPGKRYVWQVQAISGNPVVGNSPTEDNGVYKNNGLSEISYFDYVENCLVPTFLTAKNAGRGKVELRWNLNGSSAGSLYRIQYRKRGSTSDWAVQESYQEMCLLTGLSDQTEYEYRIGSVCGNLYAIGDTNPITGDDATGNAYAFSGIQYFTTDSKSTDSEYQCGTLPSIDISNRNLLQNALGTNEVFMAGDFSVTVLQSQGASGTYSGTGYIQVPYLADTKIKVTFNNIKINTDKQLIEGTIETTYDPNESAMMYVSEGIGETFGDGGVTTIKVDYTISDVQYIATPPPGRITITGNSGTGNADDMGGGQSSKQELPGGKDYTITDKDGNVWNVDEEGNVTKGGKVAEGGASTSGNTEGISGSGANAKVEQYTAKGVKIQWYETSDTKHAYDTAEDKPDELKAKYPTVTDADGNTVYVSYKAVVNKQTDVFGAKVTFSDPALKEQKVIFKTLNTGSQIQAQDTGTGTDYILSLKGTMNYAEEDVIAVLMPKDSTQKQQVISSFKLVHLEPKAIDVALVPTDEISKGKLGDIRTSANEIYSKIGVTINFYEDAVFDITPYLNGKDTISTEKNTLLSTYSSVQQAINKAYGNKNNNRYVLFVTDKKSSTGQMGYMRLGGQFGYIFKSDIDKDLYKTVAHELGHGVFKLEHPWEQYKTSEGTTKLLMDYSNGTVLTHLDWKQINDPKLKFYMFQSQEEGEKIVDISFGFKVEDGNREIKFEPVDITEDTYFYISSNQIIKFTNSQIEKIQGVDINDKGYLTGLRGICNGQTVYFAKSYKPLIILGKNESGQTIYENSQPSGVFVSYEQIEKDKKEKNNFYDKGVSKCDTIQIGSKIVHAYTLSKNSEYELITLSDGNLVQCTDGLRILTKIGGNLSYHTISKKECLEREQKENPECNDIEFINKQVAELKWMVQATDDNTHDAGRIEKLVNRVCIESIKELTLKEQLVLFEDLAYYQNNINKDIGTAAIRIIQAINENDVPEFLKYLNDNPFVVKSYVDELTDELPFDGDTYSSFIGALIIKYRENTEYIEKITNPENYDQYIFSHSYNSIYNRIWESYAGVGSDQGLRQEINVSPIGSNGKIKIEYKEVTGYVEDDVPIFDFDQTAIGAEPVYAVRPVWGETQVYELNPMDPVIYIKNNDLGLLADGISDINQEGKSMPVIIPAIALHYADKKAGNQTKWDTGMLGIDVVSFLVGYGELKAGVTGIRKAWAIADMANSAVNITANASDLSSNPNVKPYLDAYNLLTAISAGGRMTVATYKGIKNFNTVNKGFEARNLARTVNDETFDIATLSEKEINAYTKILAAINKEAQLRGYTNIAEETTKALSKLNGLTINYIETLISKLKNNTKFVNSIANQKNYKTVDEVVAQMQKLHTAAPTNSIKSWDDFMKNFDNFISEHLDDLNPNQFNDFMDELLQTSDKFKAGATSLDVISNSGKYIPSKFNLQKMELEDLISYADDAGDFRFDIKWSAQETTSNGLTREVSIFVDTKNYSSANNMFKDIGQYKAYLQNIDDFDQVYIIQQGGRGVTQAQVISQLERAIAKDAQNVFDAKPNLWKNMGIDTATKLKNTAENKGLSSGNLFEKFRSSILITD